MRGMKSRHVLSLAVLAVLSTAQAQGTLTDLNQRLVERLKAFQAEAGFPGATFAYVLPDGRQGAVAVGFADKEKNKAMQPDARMPAGSAGKTFFAAWILQEVESGRLGLDDLLAKHLGSEAWYKKLANGEGVTLRHLFLHQSGIPEHVYGEAVHQAIRGRGDTPWTPGEIVPFALDSKPLFEPGKGWAYADTNYILLALAAEAATKQNGYAEIERRFLRPFGLKGTQPATKRAMENLTMGYTTLGREFVGQETTLDEKGEFRVNPGFEWAGGGFVSTSQDLARWALTLFGGKVLKPETMQQLKQGVAARTGPGDQYGLGVQIRDGEWGKGYGHGGFYPGYLTEMEYVYDRFGVAIQFNTDAGQAPLRARRRVMLEMAKMVHEATR